MMREILFRGQTRKYGEKVRMNGDKVPSNWVYGGVCQGAGNHSIIYGNDDVELKKPTEKWVVYTDTIGQFTGLTDKNGKKIFEGDIVEVKHDAFQGARGEVAVGYGCFMLKNVSNVLSLYGFLPWCEVIGNIHDNPELLEVDNG